MPVHHVLLPESAPGCESDTPGLQKLHSLGFTAGRFINPQPTWGAPQPLVKPCLLRGSISGFTFTCWLLLCSACSPCPPGEGMHGFLAKILGPWDEHVEWQEQAVSSYLAVLEFFPSQLRSHPGTPLESEPWNSELLLLLSPWEREGPRAGHTFPGKGMIGLNSQ